MTELDLIALFLSLRDDALDFKVTQVLPEITITPHPTGTRISHELSSGRVELERTKTAAKPTKQAKGVATSDNVITIRLDNVFGRSKTIKLGDGWVQVDDALFTFKNKVEIDGALMG